MPPPHVHDHGPAQAREAHPPVLHQLLAQPASLVQQAPATTASLYIADGPGLDSQLGQGQCHSRKHVYDDLLAHAVVYGPSKDGVSAQQPGQKAVVVALLARGRGVFQQQHGGLVDEGEQAEVAGVLAGGLEDEPAFGAEGAGAEEEDHDEGVGEAHFCAVDDAIADAFDEGEDVVVLRVEDDALERFLEPGVSQVGAVSCWWRRGGKPAYIPQARGLCPWFGCGKRCARGAS